MLFSIVVPVYNVEKYLEECLDSIVNQAIVKEECEIVLVDDGSTDSSGMICERYAEHYPNLVRVFHKKNEGLLLARRYGYQRISGDYIINCDSDDCLENGMLNTIRQTILRYNAPDVILFNHYLYDGRTKTENYANLFTSDGSCEIKKDRLLTEFMLNHSVVSMWGKVYKSSCIDKEKDYSAYGSMGNGEDTLQSIEIYSNARTFVYVNQPLYDYRMGSGMTRKYDAAYYWGFKRVIEEIEKEKTTWNLKNFDLLFAVKLLQTAGRAITQSRYNRWPSTKAHKEYLQKVREDSLLENNLGFLQSAKGRLQKDHVILLKLMQRRNYLVIVVLLNMKNSLEKIRKGD